MNYHNERIDDIPLIISYLKKKKFDLYFDKHIENHGNQHNFSNGEIAIVWLAYILSEGDHRKVHVIDWVKNHQISLSICMEKEIDANNFSDDRLTRILQRCCSDLNWKGLENDLAAETMSLIPLDVAFEKYFESTAKNVLRGVFKIDSTSTSGSHEVTPLGLMQYGFSKDHRPDLPQVKIMYCAEGLSGCPIVTEISEGNLNDERIYGTILERMRSAFDTKNYLYCGDSKMSISKIREDIVSNNEFYLCPLQLSNSSLRKAMNDEWIPAALNGSKPLIQISDGEEQLGYGYEFKREQKKSSDGQVWIERVLLVKSLSFFEGEKKIFNKRVSKTRDNFLKVKSNICKSLDEAHSQLQLKLEKIFEDSPFPKMLFEVEVDSEEIVNTYERTEVRNTGKRSGKYEIKTYRASVKNVVIQETCLASCLDRLGWRLFVTNMPEELISYSGAYCYYRKTQYVIEAGFHLLKSKPIGINPLYVWREDQIKGLIRFLGLGVLFLKLLSLELMLALRENNEELMGLTAGQPKRKTNKPTTASILSYFYRSSITLTYIKGDNHWNGSIIRLSDLCIKVLDLLGLGCEVYYKLADSELAIKYGLKI